MKRKYLGFGSLFLFFLCFCMSGSDFPAQSLSDLDPESSERFLRTAKVISIQKERGRRTDSWEVDLNDGEIQGKGFFKLTDRDHSNPSGGDSFRYVIAGYEINKMLELNLVPPTVERKIQRKKGSLMLFLESPILSEEDRRQKNLTSIDPDGFEKTMCDLIVFEHLLFFPSLCGQRDLGNILIQTEKNWKVWLVDLSEAFAPATRLIRGCEIKACSESLLEKIRGLSKEGIQARVGAYLNEKEISALLVRRDLIIKAIEEL